MKNPDSRLDLKLPAAIVSLGVTGRSIHRLLLALGIPREQIFLFDAKDPAAEFHDPVELMKKKPASLIVSPGIALAQDWIQQFKSSGGQITSELAIATSLLTTEKIVGITGSIGKSTCTSLLQAGLAEFSPDSFVGGNLGTPLADYALRKIQGGPVAEWVVLELSSYQLENYANLSCAGSLVTYLTPNHMERYDSLEKYYATKWSLVEKTKGPVVANKNGGDLEDFAKSRPESLIWTSAQDPDFAGFDFSQAGLVGDHNRDNLCLVMKLATALGWPARAQKGFLNFAGLPHRLENLGTVAGVRFINDSKSTTMESVLQAVKSTASLTQQTAHLLLGGKDKNLPWDQLAPLKSGGRKFYFFGEVAAKAKSLSGLPGEVYPKLSDAIDASIQNSKDGDLVLLSPGGTSWDEFKSFEERGEFFKNRILKR